MNRNTPSSHKFSLLFSANSPTHPLSLPPSPQRSNFFARSLLSMRCLLLRYNLEPRLLNSRALGTVTSVMIVGLSINGCSHSKKAVWGEKTRLTSLENRAAAWRDSGRALFSIFLGGGGGTPLYKLWSIILLISYIGMCCPIGWGRVGYTLPILVWNHEWFLRELQECMKVFIVSIPKRKRKRNLRIRNEFEEFFCLRSNLSNDNIISA